MRRLLVLLVIPLVAALGALSTPANAVQPQVAGGTPVSIQEVPWQALLAIRNTELCGASFLSSSWLITAAHCVDEGVTLGDVTAFSGVSRVAERTPESKLAIGSIIIHPEWNPTTQWNDFALIKLAKPVSASAGRQPIALPTAENPAAWPAAGTSASFAGWGAASEGGSYTDQLQRGTVNVLAGPGDPTCGAYGSNFNPAVQICAGVPGGGIDACQGDSGGGLTAVGASGPVLAGVVSTGYGCAQPNYPGVYARVTSALPWIQSQIGAVGMSPGAPQGVRIKAAGPGKLTVSWKAPGVTGGSAITGYTVSTKPGSAKCTTATTKCTLTKVRPGSKIAITVKAVNAVGPGAPATVVASLS